MKPADVLLLPGLGGAPAAHWQARWAQRHGYRLVEQHDWAQPLRGDWITRLEEVVLACGEPAVLVAHGLGCILVAAWAAHSANTGRVKAALLVAPDDVEQGTDPPRTWRPLPVQTLPFPGVLVASRDDPRCAFDRARGFAAAWGVQCIDLGASGHIDEHAHLASWPEGHVLLQDLMKD